MTDPIPAMPHRSADAHKGTMGRVLLIAGSRAYQGAAALCAMAALRSGAGLVHLAFPQGLYDCMASRLWEVILHPMPQTDSGSFAEHALEPLMKLAAKMDAVAVGPGFSTDPQAVALARSLYSQLAVPAVFDADGLNALSGQDLKLAAGLRVLTPHPGEFRRLFPQLADAPAETAAREAARSCGAIVVYKTHEPHISDGKRVRVVRTGTAALATAGTGDVLTGMIAALLHRFEVPFDAVTVAVHLHGRAGAIAGLELTEESVVATDVIGRIPMAIREALAGPDAKN